MADLELNIGGRVDALLNKLRDVRGLLVEVGDETQDLSGKINKNFKDAAKSANSLNSEQKEQVQILNRTEKELEEVAKARKKAQDPTTTKNFNKELDNTAKKTDTLGGSFKKLGGIILAAFGTQQILSFAKSSIDAFRQQEAAVGKVAQGIKSTNAELRGLSLQDLTDEASELQKNTLFGDEEILNGATAQLLTFTNIGGEEFKRTQKVALDLATVLDGDLQSASIQLGKALNDPVANLSALSRSGIQFSKQQKEQIKVLTESGKLQEAQGVILAELERQYGGQAEAAAKADGGITQLGNAFGDVQEKIGATLVEALQPFIQGLKEFFESLSQEDIDSFLSGIKNVGKFVLVAASGFATYRAVVVATGLAQKAAAVFTTAWTIATKGIAAAQKSATASQWLLNIAMNANPVGLILAGVVALSAALYAFSDAIFGANEELTEQEKRSQAVAEATSFLTNEFTKEATEVDKVFNKLGDATTSKEEYLSALEALEKQYDVTLDDLKDENGLLTDLEEAQRRVNDAVLDNIIAKEKSARLNESISKQIANEISLQNLQNGIIDDNFKAIEGFDDAISNATISELGVSDIGTFLFGSEEDANKRGAEIAGVAIGGLREKLIEENKKIQAEVENLDEVFDAASANIKDTFKDLQFGLADGIKEDGNEVAKETEKQRKEREKAAEAARKKRIAEANALFKVENDLIKAIDDLNDKAEKARIKDLEGLERIDAQKELALAEVDVLEDGLRRKLALIELERTTTKEQLSRLTNEQREARIQAIQETIELEENQIAVLDELRNQAVSKSNDERIKFLLEEEQRIAEAQQDGVEARIKALELAEENATAQVELDALGIDSDIAREQFKEEALLNVRQQFLEQKKALILEEEQFKIDALQRELDALQGVQGAEAEARRAALEQQIDNQNQARDNALLNLELEQTEIKDRLDEIAEQKTKFNLADALGLTQEEFDKVKTILSDIGTAIFDEIQKATDEQLAANEQFINQIEGRIDEQESALDREIELNKLGFASNVESERAKLANLQEQREKALEEQEKLRKRQAVLDKIAELSSLGVAIAQIIANESKAGVIGLAIAAAAIPVLFGLFSSAKKKAAESVGSGFRFGGYTGNMGVNEVAGEVHGQEFVHTAEKTKKHRKLFEAIHTDNLPMMRGEMVKLLSGTGVTMSPDIADNLEKKKVVLQTKKMQVESSSINSKMETYMKSIDDRFKNFAKEYSEKETRETRGNMTIVRKGKTTKYIKHR